MTYYKYFSLHISHPSTRFVNIHNNIPPLGSWIYISDMIPSEFVNIHTKNSKIPFQVRKYETSSPSKRASVCACTYMYACVHTCVRVHTCVSKHTHAHTYTHIHSANTACMQTHTYTHIHIHTSIICPLGC